MKLYRIEELARSHDRTSFESNNPAIDTFLKRTARQQMERNHSTTYVIVPVDDESVIVGFCTITFVSVNYDDSPRDYRTPPGRSVSVGLLAQMAVSRHYERQGFARRMVMHCLSRFYAVHRSSRLPAVQVDATDENARDFYLHLGFKVVDDKHPLRLYMAMDAVIAKLGLDAVS